MQWSVDGIAGIQHLIERLPAAAAAAELECGAVCACRLPAPPQTTALYPTLLLSGRWRAL